MIKNWKLEITENETKLIIQDGAAMNNDILSLARHLVIKYHLNKLPVYHENGNKYFDYTLKEDTKYKNDNLPITAALIIVGVILFLLLHSHRKEKEDLLLRRKRRLERLEDIGYSSSDFDQLLSQKRSSTPAYKKQTHKVKRPRKKW